MKTRLLAPPWTKPTLTDETSEALKIISSNVWKDASVRFSAERDAKIKAGKSAPKGMQRYLMRFWLNVLTIMDGMAISVIS